MKQITRGYCLVWTQGSAASGQRAFPFGRLRKPTFYGMYWLCMSQCMYGFDPGLAAFSLCFLLFRLLYILFCVSFFFFCLSVFLYSQLLHIAWRLPPKPATTTNDNSNIMKQNKHNDGCSKKSKKDNKKRKTETKKQNIEKNNSKSNSKNNTTTATATAAAAATTTTPTITTSKTVQITPSERHQEPHDSNDTNSKVESRGTSFACLWE